MIINNERGLITVDFMFAMAQCSRIWRRLRHGEHGIDREEQPLRAHRFETLHARSNHEREIVDWRGSADFAFFAARMAVKLPT